MNRGRSISIDQFRPRGIPNGFSRIKNNTLQNRTFSKERIISIDNVPTMLLPKARVRKEYNIYDVSRPLSVIPADECHHLYLSSVSESSEHFPPRTPLKSSIKTGRPKSRLSEVDSGIGSVKPRVTFDDVCQSPSTICKSVDDLEVFLDEDEHKENEQASAFDNLPMYLDSYADDKPVIQSARRTPSRSTTPNQTPSLPPTPTNYKECACSICKIRMQKDFGGVNNVLKWILTKWRKRCDIQTSLSHNYLNRGRTPRFCNFVHQAQIHLSSHSPTRTQVNAWDGSEHGDDFDLSNMSSTNSTIGFRPPCSDARSSGTEGRPASPCSAEGTVKNDSRVIDGDSAVGDKSITDSEIFLDSKPEILPTDVLPSDDILSSSTSASTLLGFEPRSFRSPSSHAARSASFNNVDGSSQSPNTLTKWASSTSASTLLGFEPRSFRSPSSHAARSASFNNVDGSSQSLNTLSKWDGEKNHKVQTIYFPLGHKTDEDNLLPLSPKQPPPSPELVTPRAPDKTPAVRKSSCSSKKKKKLKERSRRAKKEMEEIKLNITEMQYAIPPSRPPPPSDSVLKEKVEHSVPDITSLEQKEKNKGKSQPKVDRHLKQVSSETSKTESNDTSEEPVVKLPLFEFDWSTMDNGAQEDVTPKKQARVQSWLQGRLALSQQSSRFELPMDMRLLETMSPQDYVKKYCIISSRRQSLYQKIFLKNKDKSGVILLKDLDRSLKDVMMHTINKGQIEELIEMLQINEETRIDYKLFSGMTALAERVLYPKYVTEDTADLPGYQKEKIECADFCALDWKFHGMNINPPIKKLLKQLG